MMYHVGRNVYTCDLCGVEMKWDEENDKNGYMWGCDRCDTNFCSKCFIDRHGREAFDKMMRESDLVLCPDCWEEEKK